jgi:UDP-N-acetylglucosamine:LPS N-acetylglucosamine transferase
MTRKRILYISGSLGLGHITRDLAIANELRRQNPEVELSWLAAHPASLVLKEAGENLLPEAELYADDNIPAENAAKEGYQLNLLKYLSNARGEWAQNVKAFEQAASREQFDIVIGDETYEIAIALAKKHDLIEAPLVMIYDFLGCDSITRNPVEKLGIYIWNRIWARTSNKLFSNGKNLGIFVGEVEDIPDKKFGFLLPNRRDHAKANLKFVGYVLPFEPAEYTDKSSVRAKLGYGEEPLVVCSIGGTSVGKELLGLCGQAYPIIREEIPNLRMVLVCGPRLAAESLDVPQGVYVKGYVPVLYEHFAASDLAIVQGGATTTLEGGATTTLELTALRRPFLYFPLEGHFEQQIHVAGRLARHQAGIKMSYPETTPKSLAEKVISNLGKEVTYAPIATDGAQKAVQLISQLL